jgi:hypothetical protein
MHTFGYEYWFETPDGVTHHAVLNLTSTWNGHIGFKSENNSLVAARIKEMHAEMGNTVLTIRRIEQQPVEVLFGDGCNCGCGNSEPHLDPAVITRSLIDNLVRRRDEATSGFGGLDEI